jgi:protoporphyrinogen oxidase
MEAIFLGPYNRKVWGYPLETMGTGWLGERVAAPDLERVQRNVRENRDDPGWGPNATFRFPARGGTGAIWRGAAAALPNGRIRYGTPVTAVDFDKRSVSLANGSEERWDALLSTAPLDWLCQHASGLPGHTSVKANRLGYSSTHVVGVGLRGGKPAALAEKCWMYFPDANSPYYRVTHFSHYSPANAPAGCWSLMAEVCESRHKPVDAGKVVPLTLAALRQDGLIETNADVVATWHRRMERGYPIPLRDRDELLAEVMASLEAKGALSRGRFGGWRYEIGNMDHCFMQGREATARILEGCTETTWVQS